MLKDLLLRNRSYRRFEQEVRISEEELTELVGPSLFPWGFRNKGSELWAMTILLFFSAALFDAFPPQPVSKTVLIVNNDNMPKMDFFTFIRSFSPLCWVASMGPCYTHTKIIFTSFIHNYFEHFIILLYLC